MSQANRHDAEILAALLACPAGAEREACLARLCVDSEHLARLRSLLDAHARVDDLLPRLPQPAELDTLSVAAGPDAAGFDPAPDDPGPRIGRYRLLQRIGEGGFGAVYMAEQSEPMVRRVAVKIIKLGMDTRQVIARFDAERQALALMDHPSIARILDAGATPAGRPYFVMELVRGLPITEYCARHALGLAARLNLFIQVCQAVQHAHQKGIIHRDLKPSNVLVTNNDGVPLPKVIDFGIAKATNQRLTQQTLFTDFRQLIGTPAYMSPEQADADGVDIDTRSDIYSLGVMLYELLTDTQPFGRERLGSAGYDELRRIIREEEPPRPSLRVAARSRLTPPAGAAGSSVQAGLSGLSGGARGLARELSGDLDWIVMKCLEKHRARRFETADALAQDIRRHLASEPVAARPPSASDRIAKFVRRHRLPVATAVLGVLLLAGGVTGTALGLRRAQQEALRARVAANTAEQIARYSQDVLSAVDPSIAGGLDTRLMRLVLDGAAARIDHELADQPYVKAALHHSIGKAFRSIGELGPAETHLRASLDLLRSTLGDERRETLVAQRTYGALLHDLGRYADAERLLSESRAATERLLGPEDIETLWCASELAHLYVARARYDEANGLLEDSLATMRRVLGPGDRATLLTMSRLASLRSHQQRYPEAEALLDEGIALQRALLTDDHPDVLLTRGNLALLKLRTGQTREAQTLFEEQLRAYERVMGTDHPHTLSALSNLTSVYREQGRFADAEPLYLRRLDRTRAARGSDHPDTLMAINHLALMYTEQGRAREALQMHADNLERRRRVLGPDHRDTLITLNNLALAHSTLGQDDEAAQRYAEALELERRVAGPTSRETLRVTLNLAAVLLKLERHHEAAPLIEAALEGFQQALGPNHRQTLLAQRFLAILRSRQGRFDEAIQLQQHTAEACRQTLGPAHLDVGYTLASLAAIQLEAGQPADAELASRDAINVLCATLDGAHPAILDTCVTLGASLAAMGRFEEAEAELTSAERQFEPTPATPARLQRRAAEELATLHDARSTVGGPVPPPAP